MNISPANVPDGKLAIPLLDQVPLLKDIDGTWKRRPDIFLGDHAYGSKANIEATEERGVISLLGPLRGPHGSGLGELRYVVERTLAWFGNFRRLRACYERDGENFQAFHDLAASLICWNRLSKVRTRF